MKVSTNIKNKKMIIKSAIIGLGNIGMGYDYDARMKSFLTHSNSLHNHKKFKIVGAVDINLKKRHDFEKKYKVKAYSSISDLLKVKDISFVIVANNFKNNIEVFTKIAKKKSVKFILYEKPFIVSLVEAKKILKIAKKNNINFAVNFQRNFNKKYVNIINKIPEPIKNRSLSITIFYTKNFLTNAIHYLFLLSRFVTKPLSILSLGNTIILKQRYSTIQFIKVNEKFSYSKLIIFSDKSKYEFTSSEEDCIIYKIKKDKLYKSIKIMKKHGKFKLFSKMNQKYVLDNISNYFEKKDNLCFKKTNFINYIKILEKILKINEKI